jgi:hypothetical protein
MELPAELPRELVQLDSLTLDRGALPSTAWLGVGVVVGVVALDLPILERRFDLVAVIDVLADVLRRAELSMPGVGHPLVADQWAARFREPIANRETP